MSIPQEAETIDAPTDEGPHPHPKAVAKESLKARLTRNALRLKAVFGPCWPTKLVFLHVPKCGGNSLIDAISRQCRLTDRRRLITVPETRAAAARRYGGQPSDYHEDGPQADTLFSLRRRLVRQSVRRGDTFVCGHFLMDPLAWTNSKETHDWVTVIRPPVDRMISHYREEVASGFVNVPFSAYLRTPMAENHAKVLTRYFSGIATVTDDRRAVLAAAQNIRRFSLVGDITNIEPFMTALSEKIGRDIVLHHERRAIGEAPVISRTDRATLEDMCAGDAFIYQNAPRLMS